MEFKWRIRLKPVHDKTGLSAYAVSKETGIAQNTVRKYVEVDEVITTRYETVVVHLMHFYGVDWRDTSVIEPIVVDENDEEIKTAFAVPA